MEQGSFVLFVVLVVASGNFAIREFPEHIMLRSA